MRLLFHFLPRIFCTGVVAAAALAIFAATAARSSLDDQQAMREALGYGSAERIWRGEVWRLPLNTLHHANAGHLALNLGAWILLGGVCELVLGSRRFALFLLGAAAVTTAVSQITVEKNAMGLSGVILAVFGMLLFLRRRHVFVAQILTPRAVQLMLIATLLLIPFSFVGDFPVANVAHVTGLAYGLAAGWTFFGPARRPRLRRAGFLAAHLLLFPAWLYAEQPVFDAQYHFFLGYQAKTAGEAIPHYLRALDLRPDIPEAHWNLALHYYSQNRWSEALEHDNAFLGNTASSAETRRLRSPALRMKILALDQLDRADEIPAVLHQLAQIDPGEAKRLEREVRHKPSFMDLINSGLPVFPVW